MSNAVKITTFYKFLPIAKDQVEATREAIENQAQKLGLLGLMIMGEEGFNSTMSGPEAGIEEFKAFILKHFELSPEDLFFKDSVSDRPPFHELKIKNKEEIVTIGRPGLVPKNTDHHLNPEEWHRMMEEEDVVIIDTRNDYEYEVGHFKNAINPNIKEFTEFPKYIEESQIDKDKKMMIYCTGGIRCEKAILDLHEKGYKNVYQLNGGILNYLKEKPHQNFDGECFVFDYRVAVDQELQPTRQYRLCPHCGDPGFEKIDCKHCGREEIVCQKCLDKEDYYHTCSKNCAHHHKMGHKFKARHSDSHRKRHVPE